MADIKLTNDYLYDIVNGDFALTNSPREQELQTAEMILLLDKGHDRNNPLDGAGIIKGINQQLDRYLKRRIETEFEKASLILDSIFQDAENEIQITLK